MIGSARAACSVRRLRLRDAAVPAVGRAVRDAGDDEFRQPGARRFAMLGGYVTVTLMNRFGWPFLATLPFAFLAAAVASVVLERMLYRRLYRASDLDQLLLTIGIVFMSVAIAAYIFGTDAAAGAAAGLPARLGHVIGRQLRRLPAVPDRRRARRSPLLLVARARIHALRRAGPRRGRQPAHGARPRHQCRPRVRRHLRARQRPRRARRRARDRDRRPRSELRASPISSTC